METTVEEYYLDRFEYKLTPKRYRVIKEKVGEIFKLKYLDYMSWKTKDEMDIAVKDFLDGRKRYMELKKVLTILELKKMFKDCKFLDLKPSEIKEYSVTDVCKYTLIDEDDYETFEFDSIDELSGFVSEKHGMLYYNRCNLIAEDGSVKA